MDDSGGALSVVVLGLVVVTGPGFALFGLWLLFQPRGLKNATKAYEAKGARILDIAIRTAGVVMLGVGLLMLFLYFGPSIRR